MRRRIIATILRREFSETIRNRLLMATILVPPLLLTVAPLLLGGAHRRTRYPAGRPRQGGPRPATRLGELQPRPSLPARSRSSSSWRSSC